MLSVVIRYELVDGVNDATSAVSELSNHTRPVEAWKAMPEVWLEEEAQLQMLTSPEWRAATGGKVDLGFDLPRHGVSLIKVSW